MARIPGARCVNFANTLVRLTMNIKFLVSGLVLAVVFGIGMIEGEKQLDAFSVVVNGAAKMGCSCVFVAHRPLEQCLRDLPEGFDGTSAYVDQEMKAVRTSLYGVVRGTSRFHGPRGCSLE